MRNERGETNHCESGDKGIMDSGSYEDAGYDVEEWSSEREDQGNTSEQDDSDDDDNGEETLEASGGRSEDEEEERGRERTKRQMELIKLYSQNTKLNKNDTTLRTLSKSLRKIIIPHVKFVQSSKVFGSFDQPDFTSSDCWQNRLFGNIPSLSNATDEMKAKVWITYRSKLKEQFSLHRSGVTLKIKRKFEEGKLVW